MISRFKRRYLTLLTLFIATYAHADDPLIYPGAQRAPHKGVATSINPGMNTTETVYYSDDSVAKVALWFSDQMKLQGIKIKENISFSIPLDPEIKKRNTKAEYILMIEPRGSGSLIRVTCSHCY